MDHSDPSSGLYSQRYYASTSSFLGPGHPIFLVMGGEGQITPETGLFYPFVVDTLAGELGAAVLQPEHRFYGESQPAPKTNENLSRLMTPAQALLDATSLAASFRASHGCGERGSPAYCPVIAVGGSYPGFLAFALRLAHPEVVDASYVRRGGSGRGAEIPRAPPLN